MKHNDFIFADLSTYSPKASMAFYEAVFGWNFFEGENYFMGYEGERPAVGLYETPEKFKQLKMPHFWMSYIQVNNLGRTVEKAEALGGTIEMVDHENPIGSVALIRDPQGAGFTVYQGDQLLNTRTEKEPNTLIWNELHISDVARIIPFYEGIFNWTLHKNREDRFMIFNRNQDHIADALVLPNSQKGKYEYWVCSFGVNDLPKSTQLVLDHGGKVISDEEERRLCTDHSGQAFFYLKSV